MNLASAWSFLAHRIACAEFALALIVLGARLAIFSYAGSPLPYYDQWIAEFNSTLFSVAIGQDVSALFTSHNEHLILTTKILTLLGYLMNGYWDVPFLVVCSAGIRAVMAAWLLKIISISVQPKTKLLLFCLCALIFSTPFSGFNFLNGMQVSFYLVDIALLWSLRTITNWTTPVASGLAMIGGTLFGLVSLGGAIAIPACALATHLFYHRDRPGFWPAWTISFVLAAGFIFAKMHSAAVSIRPPRTFGSIAHFWFQIISWPTMLAPVGALLAILCIIGVVLALKRGDCRNTANAVLVSLGVYAVLNGAFIAINRDPAEWHMRHWDTISLLVLAILAFGLRLADAKVFKPLVLPVTCFITLGYVFYGGNLIRTVGWPYIQAAHDTRFSALEHYRSLLLRQDLRSESERVNTLLEKRDYAFFDQPIGRFSLHPAVLENILALHRRPLSLLSPEIIPVRNSSRFSWFTGQLIAHGWLVCLCGIGLAVEIMRRDFGQPTRPDASTL